MEARGKAENIDGKIEHKVGEGRAVFGNDGPSNIK
jgi:uncharacterized protein YjbJ (UPF0337 family)